MTTTRVSIAAVLCLALGGCKLMCDRDHPVPPQKTYRFGYVVGYAAGGRTYTERPVVVCRHRGVREDRGHCRNEWGQTLWVDGKAVPVQASGIPGISRIVGNDTQVSFAPGDCDALVFDGEDLASLYEGPVVQGPDSRRGGVLLFKDRAAKARAFFDRTGVSVLHYRVDPITVSKD